MDTERAVDDQVRRFAAELDGTEWRASLTRSGSHGLCLRIECVGPDHDMVDPQALELCRRSFAEAVKSARKHIHRHA
jgi:hypothetical protein